MHLVSGLVLVTTAVAPRQARAFEPAEMQAVILFKIFGFDAALAKKTKHRVVILASGGDHADARRYFAKGGMETEVVEMEKLRAALPGASALFLPGGNVPAQVSTWASEASVLTVTTKEQPVEQGRASVSIDVADGKPRIVINITRLKEEGHVFSPELLRLARTIR